jgi:PadR family transcriptional regulator, regulatory protein PadR
MRVRPPSPQAQKVLQALGARPGEWRYGYELGAQVGLKSGSLYPILMRLSDGGLLESQWEAAPPLGRPPRHLYRLTAIGLTVAAETDKSASRRSGTVSAIESTSAHGRRREPAELALTVVARTVPRSPKRTFPLSPGEFSRAGEWGGPRASRHRGLVAGRQRQERRGRSHCRVRGSAAVGLPAGMGRGHGRRTGARPAGLELIDGHCQNTRLQPSDWGRKRPVTAELPELRGPDLQRLYYRSQFAVAETSADGVRVLCLTDDQTAATEMAEELRRRGVRAGAFRTAR